MVRNKNYNWIALVILAVFFMAGVIIPVTGAFSFSPARSDSSSMRSTPFMKILMKAELKLPDLIVHNISILRGANDTDDKVNIIIKNQGEAKTGGFTVVTWDINSNRNPFSFFIGNLNAGANIAVTQTYVSPPNAAYTIKAIIDKDNTVRETNENNNIKTIQTAARPPFPDFILRSIFVERRVAQDGTACDVINARIKNNGEGNINSLYRVVAKDITNNKKITHQEGSVVPAGTNFTSSLGYINPPSTYTVEVTVDSKNWIKETNESNNVATKQVS